MTNQVKKLLAEIEESFKPPVRSVSGLHYFEFETKEEARDRILKENNISDYQEDRDYVILISVSGKSDD